MAQKAGLGPNIKNHSDRKTMIQTLVNNDVPPIMQLSGHGSTKTWIPESRNGNGITETETETETGTETESNINDRKLKNFTWHKLV